MNFYYVDPSLKVDGNGTLSSPFNSMDSLVASSWAHPMTILIKRGTSFKWSYLNNSLANLNSVLFCNQSGTQSVLSSYGDGPLPIWYPADETKRHTYTIFQNFYIGDLQLSPTPGVVQTMGYLYGWIKGDSNGLCNMEIGNLRFIGTPESIGKSAGMNEVACILLQADYVSRTNIAHKIYIHDIYGDHVNCGIMVRGNPHLSDTTTFYGDQRKSYGVRILDISFTNIINYGIKLCGATSKNKNKNVRGDEWESGFDGVYYSSYKTNVYNPNTDPKGSTGRADVPIWVTMCSYITGQNFEIHGSGPGLPDRQSLDFDYHTNNCTFRYGYCTNNARGPMFIQGPYSNSWYAAQGYTAPSSDPYTLYKTLGCGVINNVIEYVTFYNDGIGRTDEVSTFKWTKPQVYRYCYDNTIRNCLFIDSATRTGDNIVGANPQTDDDATANSLNIDSCIFYWRIRDESDLISSSVVTSFGTLLQKISFKNCLIFSKSWAITPSLPGVVTSGILYADPKFKNEIPTVPPSGFKEAMNILRLSSSSPALSAGTINPNPDSWGNTGKNIGWEQ